MVQQCSFEERREKIKEIAATRYHTSDDAALEYLASIEGANLEEQKQLFRLILSIHGARNHRKHKKPLSNTIGHEEWKAIAERVHEMVGGWSRSAIRNNASLENTADMLWDALTLCEGTDRVVALGILLDQKAVPYAQLPNGLTIVQPLVVYDDAQDGILDKIALFNRVEQSGGFATIELAVAMARILEQIESHEERAAFLFQFLCKVSNRLHHAAAAQIAMGFLGGTSGLFTINPIHGDDAEQDD